MTMEVESQRSALPLARGPSAWQKFIHGPTAKTFVNQVWTENPIFRQVLGVCSALAVTNLCANTLVMCVSVIFVTGGSCLAYSAVRTFTPLRTRMLVQMLVIASFVIVANQFLRAYVFGIAEQIGAYIGLIITNCIILGRVEAFATKNRPWLALVDGVGCAVGYSAVLTAVSIPREILGSGSLFGIEIPGIAYPMPIKIFGWENLQMAKWQLLAAPPAGFFGLGIVMWICRGIQLRKEAAEKN
jgi:Na+-transporting NADH:ubiquinone oxidoreductase subunit D